MKPIAWYDPTNGVVSTDKDCPLFTPLGQVWALYPEPEQEPVAWQVMVEAEAMKEFSTKDRAHDWCVQQKLSGSPYAYWMRPLYTTPPKRPWVGLTDEDMKSLAVEWWEPNENQMVLIDWVDAKLKEKNT